LLYRRPPVESFFALGDDKGKALMPKIFRRQTAWMLQKKVGIIKRNTSFKAYLQTTKDEFFLLNDFLNNGVHSATTQFLYNVVNSKHQVLKHAHEMVFKEKPSNLVDPKGKRITDW
jgi:hypothetical protein